jgi:AbrB family looped-hinge helix DNA binding protein
MSIRVKVSSKFQIAVPSAVRKQLGIQRGDKLLMEVYEGHAVLIPEPENYARKLRGLHREVWEGIDPASYLRGEREAWQE